MALAATASAPPTASAAGQMRIVSPRADALVRGDGIRVVVRASGAASDFEARLGGERITGRFQQSGKRRWSGLVSRKALDRGLNHLTVEAHIAGELAYASRRLVLGQRAPGMLDLRATRRTGRPLGALARLAHEPNLVWTARLNGRRVERHAKHEFGLRRKLLLSASHGLRYGRNVLRVTAATRAGRFDTETLEIAVPRRLPLAGAGKDVLTSGPRRVRLDARSSRPAGSQARLRYRWSLVDAPRGSQAQLHSAQAERPSFLPDEIGEYRFRLVVTEPGGSGAGKPGGSGSGRRAAAAASATDTVTLTNAANVPPIGIPVDTIRYDDPDVGWGISIGDDFEAMSDEVQAVIVDRTSGEILYREDLSGSDADAENLLSEVKSREADKPLVFLSWPVLQGDDDDAISPQYNDVIEEIGGDEVDNLDGEEILGLSVVGVAGTPGSAWVNAGWDLGPADPPDAPFPGRMAGYLQFDGTGHLAFVPRERFAFDSSAPGGTAANLITLGDRSLPAQTLPECAEGGYQVELLSAEFLAPVSSRSFATNGCDNAAIRLQMADFLNHPGGLADRPGAQLIVVQSIGDPYGLDNTNWYDLAAAIGNIGGNELLFYENHKSYALFTAAAPCPAAAPELGICAQDNPQATPIAGFPVRESAEFETGKPAHLTAVVKRTRDGYFAPEATSPTSGQFTFDLELLASRPVADPAFPNSSTPEQQAALAYVAKFLGLDTPTPGDACYVPASPDVRSQYCDTGEAGHWLDYATTLRRAAYPGATAGFPEETWNTIKNQLADPAAGEFHYVDNAWSRIAALKEVYLENGAANTFVGEQAAAHVYGSIEAGEDVLAGEDASGDALDAEANMLSGFSYLETEDEDIGFAFGVLATILYLAEDLPSDADGGPTIDTSFKVSAADFAAKLGASYVATLRGLGHVRDLIVTDWSKLSAFATDPRYAINSEYQDRLGDVIEFGAARFAYETLLPAGYEMVRLSLGGTNKGITDAQEFTCGYDAFDQASPYNPFGSASESAAWYVPVWGRLHILVESGSTLPTFNSVDAIEPPSPTADLIDPLFQPYAESDGLPTAFAFTREGLFMDIFTPWNAQVVDCDAAPTPGPQPGGGGFGG